MFPSGVDADDVIARLCRGDESAFREAYRALTGPLVRYAWTLVGRAYAEDVVSDAWLQAVRDLDRFAGGADDFRAWITTITRHRALDHLRRERRRPVAEGDLTEAADLWASDDVEGAVLGAHGQALALLATLPPDQREAIVLRTVLGFDASTAAAILGKRAGAVRAASFRGLKALAAALESAGDVPGLPPERNARGPVTPRAAAALNQ